MCQFKSSNLQSVLNGRGGGCQSWDIDEDSSQFVSQNVFLCIQISTKISSTVSIKVHLSLWLCVGVVGVGA